MSEKQRRHLIGIAVLSAVALAGIWVYLRVAPLLAYADEQRSITRILERTKHQPAATPSDVAWNYLASQVQSGASNVFFSPAHASLEETQKYRRELEARFPDEGKASIDDLKWAWDRMRQAGPTANGYIEKTGQPLFDEALEALKRAEQPPDATNSIVPPGTT
jgi:DNA repair photolyase